MPSFSFTWQPLIVVLVHIGMVHFWVNGQSGAV